MDNYNASKVAMSVEDTMKQIIKYLEKIERSSKRQQPLPIIYHNIPAVVEKLATLTLKVVEMEKIYSNLSYALNPDKNTPGLQADPTKLPAFPTSPGPSWVKVACKLRKTPQIATNSA